MKNRIGYIDAAKGIGILMIMWGHITRLSNPVSRYMSSYKIAIFFIISGMMIAMKAAKDSSYQENGNTGTIVLKKAKSLLKPYFIFSLIAALFDLAFLTVTNQQSEILHVMADNLYATVTFRGISVLWFLPALFFGEVIFYCTGIRNWKLWKRYLVYVLLPVLLCLLSVLVGRADKLTDNVFLFYPCLTILKSIAAFWFVSIGYELYPFIEKTKSKWTYSWSAVLIFGGVNGVLSQINTGVDFNMLKMGKYPILFFICGVLGSVSMIILLRQICSRFKMPLLLYIGRNSLFIMATHTTFYITSVLIAIGDKIYPVETVSAAYYVKCGVLLFILTMIEIFMSEIYNRIKLKMRWNSNTEKSIDRG